MQLSKRTLVIAGVGVGAALLLYVLAKQSSAKAGGTVLPATGVDLSGSYPGSLGAPGFDPTLDMSGGGDALALQFTGQPTSPYPQYPSTTTTNLDPNIGGMSPPYVDLSRSVTPTAPLQPAAPYSAPLPADTSVQTVQTTSVPISTAPVQSYAPVQVSVPAITVPAGFGIGAGGRTSGRTQVL